MNFKAYKMDGLGNDFIIIDQRKEKLNLSIDQIVKICDRSFIGCDQLILIDKSEIADARLNFFNSDGSESGACGNGTRCVAYFISKELNKKDEGKSIWQKFIIKKIFNLVSLLQHQLDQQYILCSYKMKIILDQ